MLIVEQKDGDHRHELARSKINSILTGHINIFTRDVDSWTDIGFDSGCCHSFSRLDVLKAQWKFQKNLTERIYESKMEILLAPSQWVIVLDVTDGWPHHSQSEFFLELLHNCSRYNTRLVFVSSEVRLPPRIYRPFFSNHIMESDCSTATWEHFLSDDYRSQPPPHVFSE